MFHQLKLVAWKNLKVRKRHWFLTIVQVVIAIALFLFLAYARSRIDNFSKRIINETTVFEPDENWVHFPFQNDGNMRLWYSPVTNMTETIIENIKNEFSLHGPYVDGFNSEEELMNRYAEMTGNVNIWALIFDTKNPKILKYKIRQHADGVWWSTQSLHNMLATPGSSNVYFDQHFLPLQFAVDRNFIEYHSGKKLDNFDITLQEFPYPPHKEDSVLQEIFSTYLPVMTLFSFIFICPAVLKRVAEEKSTGIKELLKMNGMKPAVMWIGWYVHAFTADLISIIIIVVLIKVPVFGALYPLIEYCNWLVLFFFLFLYVVAAIASCFLLAALFNNPSIAMIAGLLFWILSYVIPEQILTSHPNMKWCYKMLFGLFPNVALRHGYTAISVYESRDVGVTWSNLHQSGSNSADDVTMLNVFLILIVDTVLYLILTDYVDNVNPGQYGVPKPLHYPYLSLKRTIYRLWRRKSCDSRIDNEEVTALNDVEGNSQQLGAKDRCIEVNDLCKKFGHVNAVESLYFNIRRNFITVLLGHNGAGKTTTMSIITGMIPATSGGVKVNGIDIRKNREKVQEQMGLCPQHNLVFPDLTVREHLIFFAALKGASLSDAGDKSDKLLTKLSMIQKKDSLAATLSGGMKRKLCLAMAMVGDSKVLILDEPTSGMDPESRRKFWDLLKNDRKNRTILITTHFMDEAEALADEIVIMSHGKVLTQGTPMQLKTDYKTGYHFTVYLNDGDENNENAVCDMMREVGLTEFEKLSKIENAVTFKLSLQEQDKYPSLFKKLEMAKQNSEIIDFNLKLTTLTDVFIKSKAIEDAKNVIKSGDNQKNQQTQDDPNFVKNGPCFRNSIKSLALKRVYFMRNKYHLYLPSFAIMLGIMILVVVSGQPSGSTTDHSEPPLSFDLNIYGETGVVYGGPDIPEIGKIKDIYKGLIRKEESVPIERNDVIEGISALGIENIAYYKQHMVVGASFDWTGGITKVIGLFSATAIHGPPIALNLVMSAVAETALGPDYSISVTNAPLAALDLRMSPEEQNAMDVVMLWLFLVPIGALLLTADFVIFPNAERVTNFVQVQYVCGIRPIVYWLSNVVVDWSLCIAMFAAIAIVMAIVGAFYEPNAYTPVEISTIFAIFTAYSVGAVPFSYVFSHRKSLTGAFSLYIIVGLFLGVILTVIVEVMELSGYDYYEDLGRFFRHLFMCLCPQFALTYTSVQFSRKYVSNKNWLVADDEKKLISCKRSFNPCCGGEGEACDKFRSYYSVEGANIAPNLVEMSLITGSVYFTLLCLMDSIYFKKLKNKAVKSVVGIVKRFRPQHVPGRAGDCEEGDGSERLVVPHKTDSLRANKLRKSYGFTTAVDGVSFNLTKGQCFGLLGVNGAGKSTTFKMLTREELFDDGSIQLLTGEQKIEIFNKEYLKQIGYCPQHNALNFALTGRQLLEVVGMMRGYARENARLAAKIYLKKFDLQKYADLPCLTYSGGNKRKLSIAMAFMGRPPVILLDEPTSGVDPESMQQFCNAVVEEKKDKLVSFVLCSHSMEECETLCDRIGIMKEGRIECCDTLKALQNRYQHGVVIELKIRESDEVDGLPLPERSTSSLEEQMKLKFNVDPKDKHSGTMVYQIYTRGLTLDKVFSEMEDIKSKCGNFLEGYTVSQTSLEDVFLKVARKEEG